MCAFAKIKKPETVHSESGLDEKTLFFVVRSFPSGRPGRFQPNPHSRRNHRNIALAAIGFLSHRPQGSESTCIVYAATHGARNSVQSRFRGNLVSRVLERGSKRSA